MNSQTNKFKETEIGLIPEDWEVESIPKSLKEKRFKVGKIKQKDYKKAGKYPVIDQGNNYIAGYSDDKDKVYDGDLPVAIFGDHTRIVKYIDFPFIVGADGVKILLPKKDLFEPKFFFYALSNLKIQSRGYNRHFPILKEKKISRPPFPEQQKIARVLSKIQQAIEQQDKIIESLKNLKKSLMQKLFTEGLRHTEFKETEIGEIPKSWEVVKLGDIFDIQQGKAMSPKSRLGISPHPFLRTVNVLWGRIDLSTLDYMDFSDEEIAKLRLRIGDLLVCEGGEIGRTAMWRGEIEVCGYQNHIHRLRKRRQDIWPEFYMHWMQTAFLIFGLYAGEEIKTTIPNLSGGRLKSFPIPFPHIQEQQQIAHILSTVDKKIETEEKRKVMLKELFKTMLHKLMTGEIRLKDVQV